MAAHQSNSAPTATAKSASQAHQSALSLSLCFSALNQNASGGYEFQLLPCGEFTARDGRPANLQGVEAKGWVMNAALAQNIIQKIEARQTDCVIDYEHQTLLTKQNGKPAPSAGWFSKVEWREGVGLFAVDVEWTEAALRYIESKEYKYISPVIAFDKKTGAVLSVEMAALTNNPALDGMSQIALTALNQALASCESCEVPTSQENPQSAFNSFVSLRENKESNMSKKDELLNSIRWMLNLPTLANEDEIAAELSKCIDIIKSTQTEAASFNLQDFLKSQNTDIAANSAQHTHTQEVISLRQQIAALGAQIKEAEVDKVIQSALYSHKLLPAQEAWARELGKRDLALLSQYCESVTSIALGAALNGAVASVGNASLGAQTGGIAPLGANTATQTTLALSQEEKNICSMLGVSEADYLKNKTVNA